MLLLQAAMAYKNAFPEEIAADQEAVSRTLEDLETLVAGRRGRFKTSASE